MYETPKIEKFGSFRDLTLGSKSKTVPGTDLIPGVGNSICDPSPTARFEQRCQRS